MDATCVAQPWLPLVEHENFGALIFTFLRDLAGDIIGPLSGPGEDCHPLILALSLLRISPNLSHNREKPATSMTVELFLLTMSHESFSPRLR